MKLHSCYITAFAGILDREIVFSSGITEICEANGTGKSTLAAFLKAMLYGLEGVGKRAVSENELKLYRPFSGGRFGGSLTFSTDGREYRIERYFEEKAEEVRVIDTLTGEETDRFGKNPGEAILGTDADSFLRTIYLSPKRTARQSESPVGITAKLNDLAGEVFDLCDFDDAMARLTEARKDIKLYRGTGGRLAAAEDERRELTLRLREAEGAAALAERESREAATAEAEAERLSALHREADAAWRAATARDEAERGRRERQSALTEAIRKAEEEEGGLLAHFPSGAPSEGELNALGDTVARRSTTEADLREARDRVRPLPDSEELERMRSILAKADAAKTKLYDLEKDPGTSRTHTRTFPILAAISAALLLAGATLFLVLVALGIGTVILGGLLLGFALWQRKKQALAAQEAHGSLMARIDAARKEHRLLLTEAEAFFAAWGQSGNDPAAALERMVAEAARSTVYAEQVTRAEAALRELDEKIEEALSRAKGFSKEPEIALAQMRTAASQLTLIRRMLAERRTELLALTADVPARTPAEATDPTALEEGCRALATRITKERERAAAAREKAEGYRRRADEQDDLRDAIATLGEEIDRLGKRVAVLDRTAELLTDAKNELEERHLVGVREAFRDYLSKLRATPLSEATVGRSLEISYLVRGESHGAEYLSSGWQAIADVCLRLALCDRLYPSDPPPLILDDPFVMLDESNLAAARELLARLGKDRQLLYLTCHPSRSVL